MARRTFFRHLHPSHVRRQTLRPSATFGLGVACLACVGILLATGLTLFPYYVPSEAQAYARILHITTTLRYGGLVRDLHFLAANALLILTGLHLCRVVFTGSYRGRWRNWLYGVAILLVVLLANYTGYLLPWDQTSYWAIQVGGRLASYFPVLGGWLQTLLLGGHEVGPDTLPRAFALHAGLVPSLLLVLTAFHLWRVRKDGGLAHPGGETEKVPAFWLIRAEAGVALLTVAALVAAALAVHAPIAERADPLHPPNPARAPWYFVGIQEMVSHSALWGGVVVPGLLFVLLVLLPGLDRSRSPGGIWFARDRWKINAGFALILFGQLAFIAVGLWFRGENWSFRTPF